MRVRGGNAPLHSLSGLLDAVLSASTRDQTAVRNRATSFNRVESSSHNPFAGAARM
jgi:hypothetical protein